MKPLWTAILVCALVSGPLALCARSEPPLLPRPGELQIIPPRESPGQAPLPSPSPTPSGPNLQDRSTVTPDKGVFDPRTGDFYPGSFGGVVNPRTGTFYPRVEGGYWNTERGELIPKKE